MSTFFISYTRADSARLAKLVKGLQKLRHPVWIDQELDGGQAWWDEVLNQIRSADALILCVTPNLLDSTACAREVDYARALGKPILPVMLAKTAPELLAADLARLQIVDFTEANEDSAFALFAALNRLPAPAPLPEPLPEPPVVPLSYLSGLGQQIQAQALGRDQQFSLIGQLRAGLQRPDEREPVLVLMHRLRSREDLYAGPARELDELFAGAQGQSAQQPSAPAPAPAPSPAAPEQPDVGWRAAGPPAPPDWASPGTAPQPQTPRKGGRGIKIAVAVALGAVLLIGGAVALLNLTRGGAGPVPPAPTTAAAAAPVGDACLVGNWVSTGSSGNLPIVQKNFVVSGGNGTRLAITREGQANVDYSGADPFLLVASDGTRLGMGLTRTFTSRLTASSGGGVTQTLVSNQVVVTLFDATKTQDVTSDAEWSAWTHYECSATTLKLSDPHQSMTFARR